MYMYIHIIYIHISLLYWRLGMFGAVGARVKPTSMQFFDGFTTFSKIKQKIRPLTF